MKFSIIIPFYQAEHHILVSLTSCLNQTYQNFEAIFIDDGKKQRREVYFQLVYNVASLCAAYYRLL
ncbi:glycosyltransferase [Avibacterium paragallinarum]|uniref:glycosyltransferase n=1 Tax=Avibacterium paragallinarum TaxID=728 RepID=UPI002280DF88|nr:glycosyltransferase [Avibacterium paragallinarum]WAL56375.1 glycosyltransferase [Avibacterium paragallinarum]